VLAEALAIAVALGGLAFAYVTYQRGAVDPDRIAAAWPRLYALSKNKFYIDELYDAAIVRPLLWLARGALRFDLDLIDGLVNGVAATARGWGASLARLQTGRVRDYLLFMALGLAAVLGVLLWR
jgi:NADH-quinone oxidoreductase subunit L